MTDNKAVYLEDVEIGDELPTQARQVNMEDVRAFLLVWQGPRGLEQPSRFNSEDQARRERLPGPIVPGIMSMGLLSKMVTDWSPTIQLKTMDVIFRQVVPQGTEIRFYGVITDKHEDREEVEVDLYLGPLQGQPFIRGKAVLGLPSRGE
ncbi:MAG: acyl dehydratase [Dehalococcoidia bacterium]|nr:acyl dehydratase [Dehalococcoidia bacterium]